MNGHWIFRDVTDKAETDNYLLAHAFLYSALPPPIPLFFPPFPTTSPHSFVSVIVSIANVCQSLRKEESKEGGKEESKNWRKERN